MSEEGEEAALAVSFVHRTGSGGTFLEDGLTVIHLTGGLGVEVLGIVPDTFVTGEDTELVVIRNLERVLNRVGDIGRVTHGAGVADTRSATILGGIGRLGDPVV